MHGAPYRQNEDQTLLALEALEVLDTAAEAEFEAIVHAASVVCRVPISLISLIDERRQWFKARVGLPNVMETNRDIAFCAHTVLGDELFEVPDTLSDPRFIDNPLVTGAPNIRFYAGAPLRLSSGERIGTLCVIDRTPRWLTSEQRETLKALSVAVVKSLEGRAAARQLKQSTLMNARAATVLEHSADAVIGLSVTGKIERWNPAATHLFGYEAAEAIGQSLSLLIPEADLAQKATRILRREQTRHFTYEAVRKRQDGKLLDVSVTVVQEIDVDGTLLGSTKFVRDITARNRIASDLAQVAADLRLVTDNSPSMKAYWNRDLTCRFANRAYGSWFGRDPSELIGKPIWDLLGAELFERNKPHIEAVLSGVPQNFECEIPGPNGISRQSITNYIPDIVDSEVRGFLVEVTDVTSLKNSQLALHEATAAMRQAQRLGQIGSWEWEIATDTTTWSPELYRIMGFSPTAKPPGTKELSDLYQPESYARLQEAIKHAKKSKQSFRIEVEILLPGGEQRILDARAEPIIDNTGSMVALRGTSQDITDRKQSEDLLRRSESFLARTGALAGVGGWEVDLVTEDVKWSDQVCHIHGLPSGHQPTLEESISYYLPDSRPRIQQAVNIAIAGGSGFDLELQIMRSDGEHRWIRTVGAVELVNSRPTRLAGAIQDITESHYLAIQVAQQHELMRVTLQSIGDAVITTDKDALVTWLNPVAERLTGWTAVQARGRLLEQVLNIIKEDTRLPAESPVIICLQQDKATGLRYNTVLVSRSGDEFGIEDSASPIRNELGELLGTVLVFHDVTEQRRLNSEINYRATHDALTGLVNRLEFEVRLEHALSECKDSDNEHALMFIDLDRFKLVNDACGHAAGDLLLQRVSRLLSDAVRGGDTVARMGGDEFAVLLENCTIEHAQKIAQQMCDLMVDFRFLYDGKSFQVGTSIGLVPVDGRWDSISAIMQVADSSCYAAKSAGRNRVHVSFDSDTVLEAHSGDMQWVTRIEQAFAENQFALYAQRIFPLGGESRLLLAEVLIRMRENDGSIMTPCSLLAAAERFNLASNIDKWVLRRTITLLKALPTLDNIEMLSLSFSDQSVSDRALHYEVFQMLAEAGEAICKLLCIQFKETTVINHLADVKHFIGHVSKLGIRIALDNFGTGATSFGHLKLLRIDELKIDGQFMRDILADPLNDAAMRFFVTVAKATKAKTVAKFVDSAEVLALIREMGIDYAQGDYPHQPEPIEALFNDMTHR